MMRNLIQIRNILFLILSAYMDILSSPVAFADKIFLASRSNPQVTEFQDGLSELKDKHALEVFTVEDGTTFSDFADAVREANPQALLVMDNAPLAWAMKLVKQSPREFAKTRIVATMGINLKKELQEKPEIGGVAYEVPPLTLLTSFRSLVKVPFRRVLTFYRSSVFQNLIEDARTQLARENIELVAIDAQAQSREPEALALFLATNLQEEVNGQKIDGVFVVNDNALINEGNFESVWLAKSRSMKVPFLCGIESFAQKRANFCTYAASPDHAALGQQVAQMIFTMLDDHLESVGVEYIVAVSKKINLDRAMQLRLVIDPQSLEGTKLAR